MQPGWGSTTGAVKVNSVPCTWPVVGTPEVGLADDAAGHGRGTHTGVGVGVGSTVAVGVGVGVAPGSSVGVGVGLGVGLGVGVGGGVTPAAGSGSTPSCATEDAEIANVWPPVNDASSGVTSVNCPVTFTVTVSPTWGVEGHGLGEQVRLTSPGVIE